MIQALFQTPAKAMCLASFAIVALSGCAGSSDDYPSFTIPTASEDGQRISMRFPGVTITEPVDPTEAMAPLPADLDSAIATINERAAKANAAFSSSAGEAQQLAERARGLSPESERWAAAQVSLSDLTTHHGTAALALADLDLLAAQAAIHFADPEASATIAAAQDQIATKLARQERIIAALAQQLEP